MSTSAAAGGLEQLFGSGGPLPSGAEARTDALRARADVARRAWALDPQGSPQIEAMAAGAADAARDESWRRPVGESGLLEFFCGVVGSDGLRPSLVTHALRVIGNACADLDENRERVVASGCLPHVVSLLNQDAATGLLAFAIPVLFNVCVDYEPAQKAVYLAGINPELVSLVAGPRLDEAAAFMNYICRLLGFVSTEEPQANLVHPATPFVLLSLATRPDTADVDVEDFLGQASVALTYLSQEQFQQTFLETPGSLPLLLQAFSRACGAGGLLDVSEADAEDQAQLRQVQQAFDSTLADLSAHPLFAGLLGPQLPDGRGDAQTLLRWLAGSSVPPALRAAACLALGNVARSDDVCTLLVRRARVHEPLAALLADPAAAADAALLHAALGFLKNLAIPAANKAVLGGAAGLLPPDFDDVHAQAHAHATDGGTEALLPGLWARDAQPQVQFDAVSLTRLLLVGCAANVRRLCAPPLAPDVGSPTAHRRTCVHLLVDLYRRSDNEATRTEAARAVLTVCRVLHSSAAGEEDIFSSPPPQQDTNMSTDTDTDTAADTTAAKTTTTKSPREIFWDNHADDVTVCLTYLGTQQKFPVLRSELLFVLALMARSGDDGARAAALCLAQSWPVVATVHEAVTGQPLTDPAPSSDSESSESPPPESMVMMQKAGGAGALDLELRAPQQLPQQQQQPQQGGGGGSAAAAKTTTAVQQSLVADVDRENSLVLVAEVLARCPDRLRPRPLLRSMFQRILRQGGEQLVRDRNSQQQQQDQQTTAEKGEEGAGGGGGGAGAGVG
ncbi:ARM repeat-containing protein [Xylariaceae sp. FL0804]|nr:ARM repeat-containing protein [Xylariaceae sp. FL0804]